MFNIRLPSAMLAACAVVILGCASPDNGSVFRSMSSSETGIDFVNQIVANDTFNVLNYMYFYNGGGVSAGDIDNDGLTDLFFTANQGTSSLYINKGNLRFEDATLKSQLTTDYWATGSTMVDINGDGWLDIYVCSAGHPTPQERLNKLYINNGDMTFQEMGQEYGLADPSHSTHATFLDFDLDGDLDMYLLNHVHQFSGPNDPLPKRLNGEAKNTDRLYRNDWSDALGHPVFTDISAQAGITIEGFGLGVAASDINLDGWPDLYISNDFVSNDIMYLNNRDGTFSNAIGTYVSTQSHNGMGNDIADINNDGFPEIFVSDMLPPDNRRRKLMMTNVSYDLFDIEINMGYEPQIPRNTLQLHNGFDQNGDMFPFSEIGQLAGVHETDWSWSTLFADYDNDGKKDLFITNGHFKDLTDLDFIVYRQQRSRFTTRKAADSLYLALLDQMPGVALQNTLFRNNGSMRFDDVTSDWYRQELTYSNGAIYEDLDRDGDLDLVVNCLNGPAIIMQNTSEQNIQQAYLQVELIGPNPNRRGRGVKTWLYTPTGTQYVEQCNERGFMSSLSGILHFGLGSEAKIDSLVVLWPDGAREVVYEPVPDQRISIYHSKAVPGRRHQHMVPSLETSFVHDSSFAWRHQEVQYPDHKYAPLIPRSYSTQGPGVAIGDLNGDTIDDMVLGGSFGFNTTIAFQDAFGKFSFAQLDSTAPFEDTGILLLDIDADEDLDIYVASGGSEGRADMSDRIYLNDGTGTFQLETKINNGSSSCVIACDFDLDDDLDVFVGSRLVMDRYGMRPSSTLYINNGKGQFSNSYADGQSPFDSLGMVTSALWTDFDNDNDPDLIVVGEWMPITFFRNTSGSLQRITPVNGLDSSDGWWNSIAGGDFDNDGDIDYIIGNYGLNSDFTASSQTPIQLHSGHLDKNGSWDAFIARPIHAGDGSIQVFPAHARDRLLDQFNILKKTFTSYEAFASATADNLFGPGLLSYDRSSSCRILSSIYLENKLEEGFVMTQLPRLSQMSPIHDIEILDFDQDGNLDAILSMNFYGNDVFRGWADASIGVCLKGDGQGRFEALLPSQSGYFLNGDCRSLASYFRADGSRALIATRNDDEAFAFAVKTSIIAQRYVPSRCEQVGNLRLTNGDIRKVEFHYGSGYLSQSTRAMVLPDGAALIKINEYEN